MRPRLKAGYPLRKLPRRRVNEMIYTDPIPGSQLVQYNIINPLTPTQENSFVQAQRFWNAVITENLSLANINGTITTSIIIDVDISPIDGVGNILGQAGPTSLRAGSNLPGAGTMQFDSADIDALEAAGQLDDVIKHEVGHVLGLGTLWGIFGFVTNSGTPASAYVGPNGRAEYGDLLGTGVPADVPLETDLGPGSNDSHWAEDEFDEELMSPALNGGVFNPVSRLTIAALEDLGYVVDYTQAEAFLLPPIIIGGASIVAPGSSGKIYECCGPIADPATLKYVESVE